MAGLGAFGDRVREGGQAVAENIHQMVEDGRSGDLIYPLAIRFAAMATISH